MMRERRSVGRPRASSRDTIEEAAAELFLEQSYAGTTIDDITQRAGVSRATYFNYFDSKSDLLWIDADQAIERFSECVGAGFKVLDAIATVASEVGSERVPLVVAQSDVMGTGDELVASGFVRVARVTTLIRAALVAESSEEPGSLSLHVRANCLTGAIIAAWGAWIAGGVSRRSLAEYLNDALALVKLEQ